MTASKLEDALSLSPAVQREAFQNRHKYDLIIVYDTRSPVWPKDGPLSRLWDMFFMGHDEKRLQRNPVILVGGYENGESLSRCERRGVHMQQRRRM